MPGSGKSTALRQSAIAAFQMLKDRPELFSRTENDRQQVVNLSYYMMPSTAPKKEPLMFLYDFGREGNRAPLTDPAYGLLDVPKACVAWCFLLSVIRYGNS